MDVKELIQEAIEARKIAYAPYSQFAVGAALLSEGGHVYRGCNIENASYSMAICAERTAFFKAISEGEKEFKAIAIVGGKSKVESFCPPCGACLQVMEEFCEENSFQVIVATKPENYQIYYLKELLPLSFQL